MKTVRDLILYVVIAVALVSGIVWFKFYEIEHNRSIPNADKLWRYGIVAMFTGFVFGLLISNNREQLRVRRVWTLWLVLFVVHVVAFSRFVLAWASPRGGLPIGFCAIVAFLEVILFAWLTQVVASRPSKLSQ